LAESQVSLVELWVIQNMIILMKGCTVKIDKGYPLYKGVYHTYISQNLEISEQYTGILVGKLQIGRIM